MRKQKHYSARHTQKLAKPAIPASRPAKGTKALEWLTKAVQAGYKQAYYDLGMICMRGGNGIKPDMEAAKDWLSKGNESYNNDSTYALSKLLLQQAHLDEDNARKAISWLTTAAASGHTASQRELGTIYLLGTHTETDYEESAYWLGKLLD